MIRSPRTATAVGITLVILGALPGSARAATPEPPKVVEVAGVMPGWVRVYARFSPTAAGGPLELSVTPSCDRLTSTAALKTRVRSLSGARGEAVVDLRSDLDWLAGDAARLPCHVSKLRLELKRGGVVVGAREEALSFWMDVPITHVTPGIYHAFNATPPTLHGSRSLSVRADAPGRRWRAYAPRMMVVHSNRGVSFLEVEALPTRGTLALRSLTSYSLQLRSLLFEIAGGGEVLPGWRIGLFEQGISRPASGTELSNPGRNAYSLSEQLLPAPPLVTEDQYRQSVLDNRGVARCSRSICLELRYEFATGELVGEDASIRLASLELPLPTIPGPGAGGFGPLSNPNVPAAVANASAVVLGGGPAIAQFTMPAARNLFKGKGAMMSRRFDLLAESPQERQALPQRGSVDWIMGGGTCALNAQGTAVTAALSRCEGFSKSGFRCPTIEDPIRIEDLPPAPGDARSVGLHDTLTPYPVDRDNVYGTCGTNALVQHAEAVLNRYVADLAPKRARFIDGDRVLVPEPPIQLSQAGATWATWTLSGRKAGDEAIDGYKPLSLFYVPTVFFPEAYWPARDLERDAWTSAPNPASAQTGCKNRGVMGFWESAFCATQGQPQPGVYYAWSRGRRANAQGVSPVGDGAWSVATAHLPFVTIDRAIDDRLATQQWIVAELRRGVPVSISYAAGRDDSAPAALKDANGTEARSRDGAAMTWYLPPQLAGCRADRLNAALRPAKGHAVNLVGFSISGDPANPDPVNSYFVVQNNWGRAAGYESFFAMSFAAFRYLVTEVRVFRINRACWSPACVRQLPGKPPNLASLLIPEQPNTPAAIAKQQALQALMPRLGGTP